MEKGFHEYNSQTPESEKNEHSYRIEVLKTFKCLMDENGNIVSDTYYNIIPLITNPDGKVRYYLGRMGAISHILIPPKGEKKMFTEDIQKYHKVFYHPDITKDFLFGQLGSMTSLIDLKTGQTVPGEFHLTEDINKVKKMIDKIKEKKRKELEGGLSLVEDTEEGRLSLSEDEPNKNSL